MIHIPVFFIENRWENWHLKITETLGKPPLDRAMGPCCAVGTFQKK